MLVPRDRAAGFSVARRARAAKVGNALRWSVLGLLLACGGSDRTPTTPPAVTPVATSVLVTGGRATLAIGTTIQLTAAVRDQQGRDMAAPIAWSSGASSVATVSGSGLVTALAAGTTSITAVAGASSSSTTASASVTITVTAPVAFVAGQAYFGRNGYIEYIAGNAPIILSAPHGGALTPASIPDRTAGACGGAATTVTDANTAELVRVMQQRFFARFGSYPHIVISNLSRRKLDPNRRLVEAACGNADAATALTEWHEFIDVAKRAVLQASGKGWYMDMHGHGHAIQRLELGYLLADTDLDRTDAALDAAATFEKASSISTLSQFSSLPFSALLRGPSSLGSLYANNGFPSVPSASDPRINGTDYFNGGENTRRHSCSSDATALGGTTDGEICGVQIEANFTGVRDNAVNRSRFADVTATVLEEFLRTHWALRIAPP